MKFRHFPYDQVCNPNNLMAAWIESRDDLNEAGISHEAISDYECDLRENLYALADRLINGSYHRMRSARYADEERRMLEDVVVQRAVFNAIEPIFESQFLDCSFGFRSTHNRRMAAGRLLCYRDSGDQFVVESEIANCFDSLDHDLLMLLVGNRIEDERLLRLIWLWLEDGRITANQGEPPEMIESRNPTGLLNGQANESLEIAITRLLAGGNPDYLRNSVDYSRAKIDRTEVKAIVKRILREGGKIALASTFALVVSKIAEKRLNRPINPKLTVLAAAAALAALNLPHAARFIREKFSSIGTEAESEALAINPLPGLLVNIALHEFDLAMRAAGIRLVRYGDRFAITAHDRQSARAALDLAARELSGLNLGLNRQKTRIAEFNQGVELFGYRFHEFKIAAEPVLRPMNWIEGLPGGLNTAMRKITPFATRFGERVKERINAGIRRVKTIVHAS